MQDSHRLVGVANAVSALRTGFQKGQLIAGFVNKTGVGVQPGFFDLSGQVQQRRTGVHRLNQRADRITRPRAGTGQRHAEPGKTAVGVSHGHRARFTARRNKADFFPLADGIGDRQVMDRNDAINGFNVILLQRSGDGIADGYHFAHCSPFLSRTSG